MLPFQLFCVGLFALALLSIFVIPAGYLLYFLYEYTRTKLPSGRGWKNFRAHYIALPVVCVSSVVVFVACGPIMEFGQFLTDSIDWTAYFTGTEA